VRARRARNGYTGRRGRPNIALVIQMSEYVLSSNGHVTGALRAGRQGGMFTFMAEKPLPSRTPGSSDSKSIFMRERFILNVANLRYEFDPIAILTPLPPAGRSKLAVLPSDDKRKPRAAARNAGGPALGGGRGLAFPFYRPDKTPARLSPDLVLHSYDGQSVVDYANRWPN
jgi:hypothetical protein